MNSEQESTIVKLTRIEGKLDLSNLRHDQTEARLTTIDQRLHMHGNRLGVLEAKNHLSDGERKGIALSGKVMWGLVGLIPGGAIVAALMKAFA